MKWGEFSENRFHALLILRHVRFRELGEISVGSEVVDDAASFTILPSGRKPLLKAKLLLVILALLRRFKAGLPLLIAGVAPLILGSLRATALTGVVALFSLENLSNLSRGELLLSRH